MFNKIFPISLAVKFEYIPTYLYKYFLLKDNKVIQNDHYHYAILEYKRFSLRY